jgi:hypothetical protein
VRASFKINIHLRDLLEQIKNFFGVGNIYISGTQASYEVNSLEDLDVIIAHFENYPLITKKNLTFKLAISLLKRKQHLSYKGLINIFNLKAYMNLGISDKLKESFPSIVTAIRTMFNDISIKDPQ